MVQLIASNQLTLTNLNEKAIDRTEISFWHGLSATKRPLGIYDCSSRDHPYGNEFNVTSGEIYTVRLVAKQTKGSIPLAAGIWYTAMTSGYAYDTYGPLTLVGEASEDGIGVYERKFVVASGKTKAKIFIQIEQGYSDSSTAWRIYDGQVFDENGQPLVTDQNNYGALASPMATPNGTYIWKRTITYYTDGTSNTIWEYSGVGADGKAGADGKTPYFHIAYADSADGKDGFYVGGGTNLLQGTVTASGDVAEGGGYWIKGAFNGYDAVKTNRAWRERFINLNSALGRTNAKAGDWFTISVYVKADKQIDTGSLGVYRALGDGNDGALDGISMQDKPITTQWQQYSWSFQINDISLQRQNTRVEHNSDTGDNWIYWAGWMLEKGNVATPWSPAPSEAHPIYIGQYTDFNTTASTDPAKYAPWIIFKGNDGDMGKSVWSYPYDRGANRPGSYWSDLKPTPTTDNPPKVGDTIIDLVGKIYQITNVVVGTTQQGGGVFDYGPMLTSIKGADGRDGIAGKDGNGIKTTTITYAQSTSGTTAPTTGWTSSVPSLVKGQYLWTKTVWTYTDNSSETGYSVTYISKDGNNGNDGIAGKDGVGITATSITYVGSTSGTTVPTTGWTSTIPTVAAGSYLWTKTVWTYTDNTSETGYSVAKMGNDGTITHTAYAYSADGTDRFTTVYPNLNLLTGTSKQKSNDWYMKVADIKYDKSLGGSLCASVMINNAEHASETHQGGAYIALNALDKNGNVLSSVNGNWVAYNANGLSWCSISVNDNVASVQVDIFTNNMWKNTYYSCLKVEKGSTATPWMPSSSEVKTSDYPSYIGTYLDRNVESSSDYKRYQWTIFKGQDSNAYTAYSWSSDGTDRFSTTYPNLNLLLGSSAKTKDGFFKNFDKVENGYGEITVKGTNAYISMDLSDGFSIQPRGYKPGDKYTMSMDIMFTSWNLPAGTTLTEFWLGQRYLEPIWKKICSIELPKDPSQMLNQWIRITQTSTIPPYPDSSINTQNVFLTKFTGASEGSFTMRVRKPKQEPGSIATPHMPSSSEVTTADWPNYIGQYTDFNTTASTDPTKYAPWTIFKGKDGDMGKSVWSYPYNRGGNRLGNWWSDLKPAPTMDNPPKVGDTIIDLVGNIYQITNVVVGTAQQGGGVFDYGPMLTSIKGADGIGLKTTVINYAISSSGTVAPTAGWNSQVPTLVKGQYLWTKTVWTYTDNSSETGYSVTYISKDGNNGNDGIAGKDGTGIKTTTITYAGSTSGTTAPTSGWSTTVPTVEAGSYLWTKTIWTYTDNTSSTGYSVAKMGNNGSNGDPGKVVSDTEPTTRFKGLTWKYSGTADLTASDGTVILSGTEYYWSGTKWTLNEINAHNINGNNLKITDGAFVSTVTNGQVTNSTEIKDNHIVISKTDGTVNTKNDIALDSEQGLAQKFTNINTGFNRTAGINFQGPFTSDSDGNYAQLTPQGTKLSTDVPWTKLSLMNNFNGNIEYAIINGTVYISASGVGVPAMSAGQWKQAAQLPTGSLAIPIRANRIAAGDSGDGLSWALLSNQAGGLFIRCSANKPATANLFNATLPYPIG